MKVGLLCCHRMNEQVNGSGSKMSREPDYEVHGLFGYRFLGEEQGLIGILSSRVDVVRDAW